jgi:hypothetical protein
MQTDSTVQMVLRCPSQLHAYREGERTHYVISFVSFRFVS